jgi:hypothetical protein
LTAVIGSAGNCGFLLGRGVSCRRGHALCTPAIVSQASGLSKNHLNLNGQTVMMADRGGQARSGLGRHQEVITADFMEEFALIKQDII